jgi:Topoisomerase 6 subunit A/Spo11, Toprim domain
LLPDFRQDHPELTAGWRVFYDARGTFVEPHTGVEFGLGTGEVQDYIQGWDAPSCEDMGGHVNHTIRTHGPDGRYDAVLYIEKEGFREILDDAKIKERYDIALASNKGVTVTAYRELVEALSKIGRSIFVLHDFDKWGFTIVETMRGNTRRYVYEDAPNVIDLGLRLTDVEAMALQSEPVTYDGTVDPKINLTQNGATAEECAFLVRDRDWGDKKWQGRRVELNAMTSPQLIDWLEEKLVAHDVAKVIPDEDTLADAYRHKMVAFQFQEGIEKLRRQLPDPETIEVPDDLADQIDDVLAETPELSWDGTLWQLVCHTASTAQAELIQNLDVAEFW